MYYSPDFADIHIMFKEFKGWEQDAPVIPAFRWKDGKIFALAVGGRAGNNVEQLYVHLQKRAMKFTAGLENESSFMIIPNEFVSDHQLTQEEILSLMRPSPEYELEQRLKFSRKMTILERIRLFCSYDTAYKVIRIKTLWNHLLGRKLPSLFDRR